MTKRDKTIKFIEVQEFDTNYINVLRQLFAGQLEAGKLEKLLGVIREYLPAYKEVLIDFMDGFYTEEEIDTLNELYSNPLYVNVIKKSTQFMVDIQPISNEFFENTVFKDEKAVSILMDL